MPGLKGGPARAPCGARHRSRALSPENRQFSEQVGGRSHEIVGAEVPAPVFLPQSRASIGTTSSSGSQARVLSSPSLPQWQVRSKRNARGMPDRPCVGWSPPPARRRVHAGRRWMDAKTPRADGFRAMMGAEAPRTDRISRKMDAARRKVPALSKSVAAATDACASAPAAARRRWSEFRCAPHRTSPQRGRGVCYSRKDMELCD